MKSALRRAALWTLALALACALADEAASFVKPIKRFQSRVSQAAEAQEAKAAGQSCDQIESNTPDGLKRKIDCLSYAINRLPGGRCRDAGVPLPVFLRLYDSRAAAYTVAGERRLALNDLDCLIERYPTAHLYMWRGNLYLQMKEFRRSTEDFTKAVERLRALSNGNPRLLNPADAAMYFGVLCYRARAYRMLDEYQLAIRDFTQAMSLDPRYAGAGIYFERGEALFAKGELAAAQSDLTMSIELNSNNPKAYCMLGEIYNLKGQYDLALEQFSRAIAQAPSYADAYAGRGIAYRYKGDYERAMRDLEAARALAPSERLSGELERTLAAMRAGRSNGLKAGAGPAGTNWLDFTAVLSTITAKPEAAAAGSAGTGWKGLIALGVSAIFLAAAIGALRARAAKRTRKLANLVREKLPTDPDAAYDLYQQYQEEGGEAAGFSPATLFAVFASHEKELLAELEEMSSPLHSLEVAVIFSDKGRFEQAVSLLDDGVLAYASRKETDCDRVVGILIRSLKAAEFVKTRCPGKPPRFLGAYARAFLRQGLPDKTLELLDMKPVKDGRDNVLRIPALQAVGRGEDALRLVSERPRLDWTPEEHAAAFRLYLALGLWERLKDAYVFLRGRCSVKSYPDIYYEYARRCEQTGESKLAAEAYGRFSAEGISYKDASERLKSLRTAMEKKEPSPAAPQEAPPSQAHAVLRSPERACGDLSSPELIGGKYELRMPIGEGGMGSVYEAFDRALARRVAVKKMRPELRAGVRQRQLFLQEALTIAHVTHAYIVGIHDVVEESGELYLVFEYVDGKPLSAVLEERGRLSLEESRAIFGYVCQAVDCAHRNKVLHRDIKPSNIMICKEGYAKVMDFGLARQAKDALSQAAEKEVFGTLAYMAPEQHLGDAHRSSDIFAMGATLYEMLTAELPFKGPDYLAQKERRRYASPRSLRPELPAGMDAFLAAVFEPDPGKRVAGALEFLEGLKNL